MKSIVKLSCRQYVMTSTLLQIIYYQEWNNKAEEDKKRYEREFTKWKSEGGEEALKAAKKQAKKEKRASEGKTTSKSAKPKPDIAKTLSSAGTGTSYKSKEYIESSEDSSSQKRLNLCHSYNFR